MHNFEKLLFWQKSIELAKEVYLICATLPSDEKFGLVSQIKRSVISIPSNIAEGAGRNTNKEFNQFLGIAMHPHLNCKLKYFNKGTRSN